MRRATNSRKTQVVAISDLLKLTVARKQNKRPKRLQRGTMAMSNVTVPYAQAVRIQQKTVDKSHTITGSDIVGNINISSATPIGTLATYIIAPWNFPATRQYALSKNFQKFRYRRLAFTIASNQPSTAGGAIVAGYCSNPEQNFSSSAPTNINEAFNLPGAQIVPMFVPVTIMCRQSDPGKWFNIDPDSSELMQTAAGLFVIVVQSTSNITGTTQIPLIMDYELEFSGTAVQNFTDNPLLVFPACAWTPASGANLRSTALSGEPPFPSLAQGVPYNVVPNYNVPDGPEDTVTIRYVALTSAFPDYQFFPTLEAFEENTPVTFPAAFTTSRTTWELASEN